MASKAQERGKTFEREMLHALREYLPSGSFVHRFTDSWNMVGGLKIKNETPPDILAVCPNAALLVECKAQRYPHPKFPDLGKKAISLNRVSEHQLQKLKDFDALGRWCHAYVAVLWWNGVRGKERMYEAYMVPISEWDPERQGRESIPYSWFGHESVRALTWEKSRWHF